MRSSAVIWRWNLDCSSSRTDESVSSDFANLMFPRWRIAATTLKIASWEEGEGDLLLILLESSVSRDS